MLISNKITIFVINKLKEILIMARPIKATPTLIGRDARRFVDNMNKNKDKRQTQADYNRQKAVYEKYKGIFNL
jgi:hypothetical protein